MATDLIIRIGAESKQFQEELDKISKQTEDLSDQLSTVAKVSGVIFTALVAEATLATRAFAAQEKASNALANSLQNQGLFSQKLVDSYRKQASELQALTGVDDDAIVSGQALLQNMIGQTEITKEMSQAAVDLGERLGGTEQGFEALGQAINGRTRALKQMGIEIDENLTREERTAQILSKVSQAIGGSAEAANKGLGSIRGLQSAFGDFQEAIGQRLAPVITIVITKMTEFFAKLTENKPLIDLIVSLGVAAGAVSGLGLALAGGAIAVLKIRAALLAFNVVASASKIAIRGLIGATGIGLLVVLLTEVALNWETIWPKMQAIFTAFVRNISALGSGLGKLLLGVFKFSPEKFKEGLAEIKAAFAKGLNDFNAEDAKNKKKLEDKEKEHQDKQNKIKKDAADKRKADQERESQNQLAVNQAQTNLRLATEAGASQKLIDIRKKEYDLRKQLLAAKNDEERADIENQIEVISRLESDAALQEVDRRAIFNEELLANNQEFQALSAEQQQLFLDQNQAQLLSSVETEKSIRQQAALERAQQQAAANNLFLKEQQKFGVVYATINKIMNSEIYQGTKKATTELAQLQTSSNSTLKAIGKGAAIANIVMQTAVSAMNIYAGFSTIPIVGPALGIAGAAAAVAFGGEQIGKVTAAADGGLMTGGIAGRDSIPTLTMPGEVVVPTRNFDEVVNAVADQRIRQDDSGRGGLASVEGTVGVSIEFMGDDAEKVITARQTQARALGTFRG